MCVTMQTYSFRRKRIERHHFLDINMVILQISGDLYIKTNNSWKFCSSRLFLPYSDFIVTKLWAMLCEMIAPSMDSKVEPTDDRAFLSFSRHISFPCRQSNRHCSTQYGRYGGGGGGGGGGGVVKHIFCSCEAPDRTLYLDFKWALF